MLPVRRQVRGDGPLVVWADDFSNPLSVLKCRWLEAPPARTFGRRDFRHDPDRDALICPAGETLPLIGVYAERHRAAYRIYGRRNCGTC